MGKGTAAAGVAPGEGVEVFAPAAALAIATTFGTASIGTAIVTLSGAAHAPSDAGVVSPLRKDRIHHLGGKHCINYAYSFSRAFSSEKNVRGRVYIAVRILKHVVGSA